MPPKRIRCKWYNEVGWPRVNPISPSGTGCRFSTKCWYVHPDNPDWDNPSVQDGQSPTPKDYPDGTVPRTPTPPWARPRWRSRSRSRSPLRRVKEEPRSPALFLDYSLKDRSDESERERRRTSSSVSLIDRIGRRRSASPYGRSRNRSRSYSGRHSYSRDRDQDNYRRRPSRSYSRERDRDYNRDKSHGFGYTARDKRRDRERSSDDSSRTGNSSSFTTSLASPRDSNSNPLKNHLLNRESSSIPSAVTSTAAAAQKLDNKIASEVESLLSSVSASIDPPVQSPFTPIAPRTLQNLALRTGFSGPAGSRGASVQPQAPTDDLAQPQQRLMPPVDPPPLPAGFPPPTPDKSDIALNTGGNVSVSTTTAVHLSMPPPPPPSSVASSSTIKTPTPVTTPTAFQYNVPPKPNFLDTSLHTGATEKREVLPREERADLWDKRIELLSEAIAAKRAINERQADVRRLENFASPERIANVHSPAREQIIITLQATEAEVDKARERANAVQHKILELDFWPVRRKPETHDSVKKEEEKEEDKEKKLVEDEHAEIRERMSELGDVMTRMDRQMKEVALLLSSRTRSGASGATGVLASTATTAASVAMDWEPTDMRGQKRRKTGDDGAYASDSGSATLTPQSPVVSSSKEPDTWKHDVHLLTHRLSKLETSYHELENLYHQDRESYLEEVNSTVEAYVENMHDELVCDMRTIHSEKLKKTEEGLTQMDVEIREVAGDVAGLIESLTSLTTAQSRVEQEWMRVEAERAQVRATMEETANRNKVMQAQLAANIEETQTLRQQLQQVTQSLPPPPAPRVPSLANITDALLPRVLGAVRTDLESRLLEQRTEVIKLMRENAPLRDLDSMREQVEKIVRLPEVLSVLQNSGVLSANGNLNFNGNGANINGVPPNAPSGTIPMNGIGQNHPSKPPPTT